MKRKSISTEYYAYVRIIMFFRYFSDSISTIVDFNLSLYKNFNYIKKNLNIAYYVFSLLVKT